MAEPRELPSQDELRRRFTYNEVTGELVSNKTGNPVGWKTSVGYIRCDLGTRKNRCQPLIHRVIWKWMTGDDPDVTINHINEQKDDNTWDNLELATNSEQQIKQSRRIHPRRNIDEPWPGYYRVRIKRNGKSHLVGYYYDLLEAQQARDEWLNHY